MSTQPPSLLPSRADLQPGVEEAARAILDALREGSAVIVDEGRAIAVLAEVMVAVRRMSAQGTAREIAEMAVGAAEKVARTHPTSAATFEAFADMVRRAYEVGT